eukprot:1577396-Pleurochrysis_carterae.AAC.1
MAPAGSATTSGVANPTVGGGSTGRPRTQRAMPSEPVVNATVPLARSANSASPTAASVESTPAFNAATPDVLLLSSR